MPGKDAAEVRDELLGLLNREEGLRDHDLALVRLGAIRDAYFGLDDLLIEVRTLRNDLTEADRIVSELNDTVASLSDELSQAETRAETAEADLYDMRSA